MDFPKSVPSVGLVDGKFVDEDVVAGTPGSLIPAQWGNAVTEELLNVIESAGLTPDEGNNTQLLAAINAAITAAIPGAPPDASTTSKGLVELATDAETQTGTDAQRAVTPAALTARTATLTRAGIIELATAVETQAGTDAVRAVTPAGLSSTATTSTLDATAGKLARIGDFGLGGAGPTAENVDAITATGVYSVSASSAGTLPSSGALGTLFHLERNSSLGRAQIFIDSGGVFWYRSSVFVTGAWRSWSNNTPISSETVIGLARIATQFETNLGTSDALIVTPAKLRSWSENWLFTAEFPISPGTANAITYPNNKFPTSFHVRFKCTGGTGTAGYSVGDEVDISSWLYNSISTANNTGPYLHSFTSTGCVLMQANGASSFLPHKATGAVTAITVASFSIVVRMTP